MRLFLTIFLACSALLIGAVQDSPATLRDDGRAGTVTDRQGTALVRPVGKQRWTPLDNGSVLELGDQVRTSVRGANAVELRLPGGGGLVLGPGGWSSCRSEAWCDSTAATSRSRAPTARRCGRWGPEGSTAA